MSGLHNTRAYWSGVLAMTLCVFVLIASEFMPVSLLTPIAGDLHITEGLAGQGIALSGALAAAPAHAFAVVPVCAAHCGWRAPYCL